MFFRQVYDSALAQAAYFIGCQRTGEAIVIDPARDIDRYVALANDEGFTIVAAADTHIHADYLSGVREFVERLGKRGYVSDEGGEDWRYLWPRDGDDVVRLRHGDTFSIGHIDFRAAHTPGHTPEHLSYFVTDRGGGAEEPMGICTGDLLFVGDMGRPDLLDTAAGHVGTSEPAARALAESARALLALEDYLQVWPGHGAGSACGKALGAVPQTTIGYERRRNPALMRAGDADGFVDFILAGQPEPPPYFARMKKDNREGPAPVVLATPQRVPVDRLPALAANTSVSRHAPHRRLPGPPPARFARRPHPRQHGHGGGVVLGAGGRDRAHHRGIPPRRRGSGPPANRLRPGDPLRDPGRHRSVPGLRHASLRRRR